MGLRSRRLIRVPMLTAVYPRQRMQRARNHRHGTIDDWKRVSLSDDSCCFFCYTMWTGELMCDVYLRIPSHLDTLWDAPLTWTSWRIKCIPLWRLSSLAKMESFNKTVFHGTFPKDEGIVPRTWQGIHFIVMAPKFAGHESNQAFAVWVGETVASSITTTT